MVDSWLKTTCFRDLVLLSHPIFYQVISNQLDTIGIDFNPDLNHCFLFCRLVFKSDFKDYKNKNRVLSRYK